LYTILSAVFSLGAFSYSFLLISAKDSGFSVGQVPLFYLIFTFVAAVASIPAGKLADKFGRKKVLYFSFVSWITVMFLIISLRSVFGTVLAFIFYGLHKGALDTSQRTLIADLAPKEYLSSTLGGFQMIVGLCSLPASFFAGLLWDKFGMLVPFYVSIVLSLVAVFMLKFVKESKS
jgi:MFS family permease